MAKFGLFGLPELGTQCLREYIGDSMRQNKQFVEISKDLPGNRIEVVAVIHLDKGQSVIKISD